MDKWNQLKGLIKREVREGEIFPMGYGFCYRLYDRNVSIFYPFPFNHVIALVRRVWLSIRHARPDDFVREMVKLRGEKIELEMKLAQYEREILEMKKKSAFVKGFFQTILNSPSSVKATCDRCGEAIDWCDCPVATKYSLK